MALNPIAYTEKVIDSFLRYQLTAYAFADPDLYAQMRALLSLEETRRTPLMQGPYVSLSRAFARGAAVKDLVAEGIFHPHMANLIPFSHVYKHQENAIRAIHGGQTTLVSTGTGSGKTECFLYPIISKCLQLRDDGAPAGVVAVIVYPMNALAEDQLGRLRGLLAGTGITFGMYVGTTPEKDEEVRGERLRPGASHADYNAAVKRVQEQRMGVAVHPAEERCSREMMRTPGQQPRILLTNVKQLELLLTRQSDVELFDNARLDFLIFDEAHTFSGANGAETACLIRRLRAFCGKGADDTTCVATSATIADISSGPEAGKEFAARFFGVKAADVALVNEKYEQEDWAPQRTVTPAPAGDLYALLQETLRAVDAGDDAGLQIRQIAYALTGTPTDPDQWHAALYDLMTSNEIVYQLAFNLRLPKPLYELLANLQKAVGRAVSEEELLVWLTLGAAARKESRPLLRPVVHAFVRGVGGAVVTFPSNATGPRLYLSAEQEEAERLTDFELFPLKVWTCTTCGQHYFAHSLQDFDFTGDRPGGGTAIDDRRFWQSLDEAHGGRRVLLVDKLVGADDDDDAPGRTAEVFFCRHCGTLHPVEVEHCDQCGRKGPQIRLLAVQQNEKNPGKLRSCICCKAIGGLGPGGRYREPIRQVRATTVADVHVLAQEMIRHSERPRLLVFADNRQDAAFQAGWMKDHARRFRLRALMWERIKQGRTSVSDLVAYLDDLLDRDDDLSRVLIPEVWDVFRKDDTGVKHADERRYFLRIQVLREITAGPRQRLGLEPWGRLRVEYNGLQPTDAFITHNAGKLNLTPDELLEGIGQILDVMRRKQHLYDREGRIFTKLWQDGDRELQRGYLPSMRGVPRGLKLQRETGDDEGRVSQWISSRGATVVLQIVRAWGVPAEELIDFIGQIWQYLIDQGQLVHAPLLGPKGNFLKGCHGTYQIDADKLYLTPHSGLWRCGKCRRAFVRSTPSQQCPAWHCDGTLKFEGEDPEDYDMRLLDGEFQMLRAREHSAQVPHADREVLERIFKGNSEAVNTLVCTPTLELGVDIGALDAVLMRNVPPLPANYWQRAGRAGRRHRMAVDITYARSASHDQYYFANPGRMLEGVVEPPRFNLLNEVMVRKHIHAAVITRLHQLSREGSGVSQADRETIAATLDLVFPPLIKDYLFNAAGNMRPEPLDVMSLGEIIVTHEQALLDYVRAIFTQGWPDEDRAAVEEDLLHQAILTTANELTLVVRALKKRLDWAIDQIQRLNARRNMKGTLEPEDDALFARCDRLIKRYKGQVTRKRRDAEGFDDIITFGVLAAEGFLPGYGLETGSIIGTAIVPRHYVGVSDFDLPRPPAMGLREFIPGNMIYANGHRFVARYFHLDKQTETAKPLLLQVDPAAEAVTEIGSPTTQVNQTSISASTVLAVPICDVDLSHNSHITDEEDYRFQLQVAVYGKELDRHSGGVGYQWSSRDVLFRRAVHLRLVNVGAANLVKNGRLGYPVCLVCGQSNSPMSSAKQLEHFAEDHGQRCGRPVEPTGFFVDTFADALSLPGCADREEAYSVMEAIRTGAARVLDMERDDLQVLVIGQPGSEKVDALLYDPMPGGSGLLGQICARFSEVIGAAKKIAQDCPSVCATACIDCLCTFRNAYFHRHLNRKVVLERLATWGETLDAAYEIPPKLPATPATSGGLPVNDAETLLRGMLQRAGFPDPEWHHQIQLEKPLGSTSPDCFFAGEDEDDPGTCIYLDGLSEHIHGNEATWEKDQHIRMEMRARHYEVIEIAASDLYDREKMRKYFFSLGRVLVGKDRAKELRDNPDWFDEMNTSGIV